MKRLLKGLYSLVWRLLGPIRRPIGRRLDGYLHRVVVEAMAGEAPRFCRTLRDDLLNGEMHYLLDGVLRELVRLQLQLEAIEQLLDGAAPHLDEAATSRRQSA